MRLAHVCKRFGDTFTLRIDELSVERDTVYAVMGANGSGKTTLARLLCGLILPDEGDVSGNESVRFMPQKRYAFYGSVIDNIMMGACDVSNARSLADALADALELRELSSSPAKKVSGGELGRMALARVLMGDAEYLILDEPTASLDIRSTLQAEHLIGEYRDRTHAGVMVITHSTKQAARLAERLIFLDKGRIVEQGSVEGAFSHPRSAEFKEFLRVFGV